MATGDNFILVNAAEDNVKMKVSEMMESADMCKCEKCYMDVCKHALNRMPNQYVTSRKGEVMSNLNTTKYDTSVALIVAASTALEIVKGNPEH